MSPLKSVFSIENLRRYREPGILFGGGLLAGFLIFLAWLALRSSSDVDSAATEPEAATAAAQKLQAGGDGVLGGITGGAQAGAIGAEDFAGLRPFQAGDSLPHPRRRRPRMAVLRRAPARKPLEKLGIHLAP